MATKRTTIMLNEVVKDKVDKSGVKNFSKYVENLIKADLSLLDKNVDSRKGRVDVLYDRLGVIEKDWLGYVKGRQALGDERFNYGSGGALSES